MGENVEMTTWNGGHTALDVGDWFLRNPVPGEPITHLKLQKLVYYAQAWSLALLDAPLFAEDFEAWAHGPVARSIYRAVAGSGWSPLPAFAEREPAAFSEDQLALLSEVAETYGAYTAKGLEAMTHSEAPWVDARQGISPEARSSAVISKTHMAMFYKEMHSQADGQA